MTEFRAQKNRFYKAVFLSESLAYFRTFAKDSAK